MVAYVQKSIAAYQRSTVKQTRNHFPWIKTHNQLKAQSTHLLNKQAENFHLDINIYIATHPWNISMYGSTYSIIPSNNTDYSCISRNVNIMYEILSYSGIATFMVFV